MLFIYLSIVLFPFSICLSQTTGKENTCFGSHFVELKSSSPEENRFSNLEFLKEILKDVDIVTLGEESHGHGTSFETKIKLVKFLHEELGFDVIAFESGFYDCHKAWQLIEQGENADTTAAKGIFGIWSKSKQFQPLFKYIEDEKHGKHPLILAGFDFQFSGEISEEFLVNDLKNLPKANLPLHLL